MVCLSFEFSKVFHCNSVYSIRIYLREFRIKPVDFYLYELFKALFSEVCFLIFIILSFCFAFFGVKLYSRKVARREILKPYYSNVID